LFQEESKQPLVAFKRYEKPREVEHVFVAPDSKVLGKALKKDNKIVKEALEVCGKMLLTLCFLSLPRFKQSLRLKTVFTT
jgi:glycyl-tRNA synthetase (class II)